MLMAAREVQRADRGLHGLAGCPAQLLGRERDAFSGPAGAVLTSGPRRWYAPGRRRPTGTHTHKGTSISSISWAGPNMHPKCYDPPISD